jgi:hypothetical protein
MKYAKPQLNKLGNARELVLSTDGSKQVQNVSDHTSRTSTVNAYEADE